MHNDYNGGFSLSTAETYYVNSKIKCLKLYFISKISISINSYKSGKLSNKKITTNHNNSNIFQVK